VIASPARAPAPAATPGVGAAGALRARPARGRFGFTIIELALAATIAAVILAVALGLFGALDRTDRRLEARMEEAMGVARTRQILLDLFNGLVMSDLPQPATIMATPETPPAPESAVTRPPPRFLLTPDPELPGFQRLELVVDPAAAPADPRLALVRAEPVSSETTGVIVRAARGVLALRPTPPDADDLAAGRNPAGLTLYWQPMPAVQVSPDGTSAVLSTAAAPPIPILSGIARWQWQVFKSRQKLGAHEAAWERELPAYIMLKFETVGGTYADWMFEVDWTVGPEVVAPDLGAAAAEDAEGDGAPGADPEGRRPRGRDEP